MTERDRWIIYPLLFLAIGLSLYARFFPANRLRARSMQCDEISCRHVRILGASGREEASLNERGLLAHGVRVTAPGGEQRIILSTLPPDVGRVEVLGAKGEPLVVLGSDPDSKVGEVALFGEQELPVAVLTAERGGGSLATFTDGGTRLVYVTHNNEGAGTIVSFDLEGKPHFYLTASQREAAPDQPSNDVDKPDDAPAEKNDATPPGEKAPQGEEAGGDSSEGDARAVPPAERLQDELEPQP